MRELAFAEDDVVVAFLTVLRTGAGFGTALNASVSKLTVAALGAAMTEPRARLADPITLERPVDIAVTVMVEAADVSTLDVEAVEVVFPAAWAGTPTEATNPVDIATIAPDRPTMAS